MNRKRIYSSLRFIMGFVLIGSLTGMMISNINDTVKQNARTSQQSVCPPFNLYDEDGNIIDPVNGINADKPYSPKQTCGKCHDYEKITKGFHFQQGKDEAAPEWMAERYQWVTTPGNYGGTWCSPAPLYRHLSPKKNSTARTIDMTSFSFITAGCGECHPGGGPAEYDREGNRYDRFMIEKGYKPGAENDFDGDYFQARWSETGVLEADCMICHLPGYNNDERKNQLKLLNFRWAPSAAWGLAKVTGSVDKNSPVKLTYDLSRFGPDGKLSPNIVREPRNEACLFCHAQPGWKKRGANYDERTDVHLRAGLKCVDCHPAGSRAKDSRINEREMHQFSKGDDPGGHVRDDLDNTVLDCNYCHTNGNMGAPVAKHTWLPQLHLDHLACQTCHVPERIVKAAQVQASDVFNNDTKIPSKGKRLWTFYGPDMLYYNHYGNLQMMGFDDKPSDPYKPVFINYKGKIRPANRVHSTWPGIEIEGKPGLMQPKMGDIVKMWEDHMADPSNYPELSTIKDDNGDEVIEVNRPEEIDALIKSVSSMLVKTKYPMEGKRVVWVMNDRVYTSGTEYYSVKKDQWEASPYANVHTYNHEVFPANAALGVNGCTDCHSFNSEFFYGNITLYPFDGNAEPVTGMQYKILGSGGFMVWLSVFREQFLKAALYPLAVFLLLVFILSAILNYNRKEKLFRLSKTLLTGLYLLIIAATAVVFLKPDVRSYVLPSRLVLDANHFLITVAALMAGAVVWVKLRNEKRNAAFMAKTQAALLILAIISGFLMIIKFDQIYAIVRIAYTVFDLAVVLSVLISSVYLIINQYRSAVAVPE